MDEKMTMEITNDRLEEAIKQYAAEAHQGEPYHGVKPASSDQAVCAGNA